MLGGTYFDAGSSEFDAFGDLFTQFNGDTDPDGLGGSFSGAHKPSYLAPGVDGFGPGDYSGDYTGQGDSIYWGPYGDDSSTDASSVQHEKKQPVDGPHFGPGFLVPTDSIDAGAGSGGSGTGSGGSGAGSGDPVAPAEIEMQDLGNLPDVPEVPDALFGSSGTSEREQIDESLISLDDRSAHRYGGTDSEGTGATGTTGTTGTTDTTDPSYQSEFDDPQNFGQGGSVEMQPLRSEAETMFWDHYDPNEFFNSKKVIAQEYGISEEQAGGSAFDDLRNELQNLFYANDTYDGDSYWGDSVPEQAGDSVAGAQPVEADGGGGGSIEMQTLTPGGDYTDTAPSFVDTVPDSEAAPLLGDHAAPMPLDDLPSGSESAFSWEMLDPDMIKSSESLQAGLTEALADESALSLGSAGIGTEMSAMGSFLQSRAIDGIMGVALMPYFDWLDDATGTPWVSRSIQGTLALYGLLGAGDPFGAIAAPIGWGIQEYMKQRERLLANKDPEAERGRKFGYVREGNKWYPAIQTLKERDEGWIGSNNTQVTFQYGSEIKWRKGKLGEWIPYFEEGTYGIKNFHVNDSEVDDPEHEAGKDYQRRVDPLRDFYYLSEEETLNYLHNVMGGDSVSDDRDHVYTPEEQAAIEAARQQSYSDFGSNVHDDESWMQYWGENGNDDERAAYNKRSGYVDQLQDIRQTLEFMQSYRYSEAGSLQTTDFGMDEFEGSREFRETVNDQGALGIASWDNDATACNPQMGCYRTGTKIADANGRPEGFSADDVYADGTKTFQQSAEMRWLTDEFFKQKDLLYKAQKAAGLSKGFDKIFGPKMPPEDAPWWFRDASGEYTHMDGKYSEGDRTLENSAWALYQDNAWEFGALDTTTQLQDALAKIEASGSSEWYGTDHYRNDDQRTYLAQKAYTRYLFSKINQLGGYDYTFGSDPNRADDAMEHFFKDGVYDYRHRDPDRYRSTGGDGLSWGLDPMYSELDDGLDPAGALTYGSRYINHRDGWEDPGAYATDGNYGQDNDALYNLRHYGIIGTDAESNPDYIAGNFNDMLDYNAAMGNEVFPWDPVQERYVKMGDQTPGLIYNDETGAYEEPDGWGKTDGTQDAQDTPVATLPTLDEDEQETDTWGGGGYGQVVDGSWFGDFGGLPIPGVDYPETFVYNSGSNTVQAPDGSTFDLPQDYDEAWDYYDMLQAVAAQKEQQDDEDAADADADASATQTVPDDHPGTVHDPSPPEADPEPSYQHYPTNVTHPVMHFAPDATAPAHIPIKTV